VYIRFDLENYFDLVVIKSQVLAWSLAHDLHYTEKTIWNKRQQHHRVCLSSPGDYSLFALTWPESAPKFTLVHP